MFTSVRFFFLCAIFLRKQQVAAVCVPVTRSLSGPITVWPPSAVNSMLSLWELMSRFRVCPWASVGPANDKKQQEHLKGFGSGSIKIQSPSSNWENTVKQIQASLRDDLNLLTGSGTKEVSKPPLSERKRVHLKMCQTSNDNTAETERPHWCSRPDERHQSRKYLSHFSTLDCEPASSLL